MININNDTQIPEYNAGIGSIAETINNTNGTAIKFINGIMICYTSKNGESWPAPVINYDTGAQAGYAAWTFPVQFIEAPICIGNISAGNNCFYSCTPLGTNGINVQFTVKGQSATDPTKYINTSDRGITAIAIGRWK